MSDHLVRPVDEHDGSYPSASAYLLLSAQRLVGITDDKSIAAQVEKTLGALSAAVDHYPRSMTAAVLAYHNQFIDRIELAVVGDDMGRRTLLDVIYNRFLPFRVIAGGEHEDEHIALLRGRLTVGNRPTAYVCQNYACQLPVTDSVSLAAQLDKIK